MDIEQTNLLSYQNIRLSSMKLL